jgi:hypothetical protein
MMARSVWTDIMCGSVARQARVNIFLNDKRSYGSQSLVKRV